MTTTQMERTLDKMIKSQESKRLITDYLKKHKPHLLGSVWKEGRIRECCNVLRFKDDINGEKKIYKANFCKYDKFCLACSTRRAIKMIQRFEKHIIDNGLDAKHWYHITLTIKHNKTQTLQELMEKLQQARQKLAQRFRNSKRKQHKDKSFMHNFDGLVSSIEITYGRSGWHPHIHMLVCGDKNIEVEYSKALGTLSHRLLQKERYKLTGDSYSVGMRKIDVNKNHFSRRGIGEVFKYAVKFSKLDIPQLAEVIELQYTNRYRFFATYGLLRNRNLYTPN